MPQAPRALLVSLALLTAAPAGAIDRWDLGPGDDSPGATCNEMRHGTIQTAHDFDTGTDQDWALIVVKKYHSYDARVGSGSAAWFKVPDVPTPPCTDCGTFALMAVDGTLLIAGVADSGMSPNTIYGTSSRIRWIASTDARQYLRTTAGTQTNVSYDLEFYDSTYLLPRFNNSGTQVTILVLQNGTAAAASVQIHFFNGAGTLLHSEPVSLAAHGTAVLNTSTVVALQGMSGSAVVAHTAGYGGLAGKGVALEPSTGFTFDTALAPIAY